MNLLAKTELNALSLYEAQLHNHVQWALVEPRVTIKHGDIGIDPCVSYQDAKMLLETEAECEEAFAWVKTL